MNRLRDGDGREQRPPRAEELSPFASGLRRPICYGILLAAILPNLVWVVLDRAPWVSDTALYGLTSVELHHLMVQDPAGWIEGALSIRPKPPIIPWVGQFLVPFGTLIGNVDASLLLLTFLAQAMAVLLLFEALLAYGPRSMALVGGIGAASAPLFVSVSKQLYVQPIQLAAVCWFLYIMARSRKWDPVVTVLQLGAATSFAMLATMSSPAFCAIPGAVALGRALTRLEWPLRIGKRHGFHLTLAAPLVFLAVAWYWRNLSEAMEYGNFSFGYVWGGMSGAAYLEKLGSWIAYLLRFGLTTILAAVLLLWSSVKLLVGSEARGGFVAMPVAVGLLQIAMALMIVASSEHQTPRYPLPLLGFVVLILGVSLVNVGRRWVTVPVMGALVLQLGVVHAAAFGLIDLDVPDVRPLRTDPGREREVLEAISTVGAGEDVEVVLVTSGLGIYQFEVKYHLSKKPEALFSARPRFTSAEFLLTSPEVAADADEAWKALTEKKPAYFVVLSPRLRQEQRTRWLGDAHGWSAIMLGAVEISERVVADDGYRLERMRGYPEIEVYRRVSLDGALAR